MFKKDDIVKVVSNTIPGLVDEYPNLYGVIGIITDVDEDGKDTYYEVKTDNPRFTGFLFHEWQLDLATADEIINSFRIIMNR